MNGIKFSSKTERYHEHILSLSSRMSLAIIFTGVIPELIDIGTSFMSSNAISLSILSGFVAYHLIEKYTYKHAKTSKEITREIGYSVLILFLLIKKVVRYHGKNKVN